MALQEVMKQGRNARNLIHAQWFYTLRYKTQSNEDKKPKEQVVCFFGHFRPKVPVFVGNLPILLQICRKSSYTFLNVLNV